MKIEENSEFLKKKQMVPSNQRVQMIQARAGYRLRAEESLKAQCSNYDLRGV